MVRAMTLAVLIATGGLSMAAYQGDIVLVVGHVRPGQGDRGPGLVDPERVVLQDQQRDHDLGGAGHGDRLERAGASHRSQAGDPQGRLAALRPG